MRFYLSENRAVLFILFSAFVYLFLYFPFLGWRMYVLSSSLCMLLVAAYVLVNIDTVLNLERYRFLNLFACLYFGTVLLSKTVNGELSLFVLITFFFRCSFFPFVELQREKGHIHLLYKVFLLWFGFFLLLNDALMVVSPGRFYGDGISRYFLLGNKFNVGYDHILFLIIFCIVYSAQKNCKRWLSLLFLLTCCICFYIDCRTTVFGTLVVFLVYMASESVVRSLGTRRVLLAGTVICAMFVFFPQIARLSSVKYLITEVLGRDVTLTGRQQIFAVIPKVIRRKLWLGYGSSAAIMSKYTGAFDAQNGFFDLVVCNGLISAVMYVLLLIFMVKRSGTKASRFLLGGLYAYLVMSMVEVTYGTTMLLFAILLFTESPSYKDNPVHLFRTETQVRVQLW